MNWPDYPQLWSLLSVCEDRWRFTYPGLEIEREVLRMGEWLEANPRRAPKKNWKCFMVKWLARSQASIERAEVREAWQCEQRRIDAAVGRYNPNGITAEQAERNKRDIAEMLKRYPDLA